MGCSICHRGYDAKRLPLLCAVDARNQLYQGRVKNLQLLMENEKLQADIRHLLSDSAQSGKDIMDSAFTQRRLAEDRTNQILASADRLREEIQAARDEIAARRAALARRRSDLATASDGLGERRARQQHEVDKSVQALRFRWSQSAYDMARTRAFICNEAIRLYGLKRTRKGTTGRYDYLIGRVPVVDLTSMDSLSPEAISTSLANVAHILKLVAHYLAIRLPAEIVLPHRDYPRPAIFNLFSSYQHGPVPFPTGSSSAPATPQARDCDSHHVPRPRPLFVDKPLPQLSKEDPAMYSFFLEGVTLLAYDITWLCSTQGLSIGDKGSFEEMCHMGRNLYNFLLGAQLQGYDSLSVKAAGRNVNTKDEGADSQANWIGRYSHGTTYYFLGGVQGTEFVRAFKLPGPMKLADKLKKKLLGDAPAADWEMLDDEAWRVDGAPIEDGGVKAKSGGFHRITNSDERLSPRIGSSGWTKVKHRS